jgi:hypothetical protein
MKFFVPGTKDDAHGERLYESIRQYNARIEGMNSRRIFAIDYLHNGTSFHNEVGRPDPKIDDVVLAILETDCYYCVCTINRGVVRGEPILVDPNEVVSITEFDTED